MLFFDGDGSLKTVDELLSGSPPNLVHREPSVEVLDSHRLAVRTIHFCVELYQLLKVAIGERSFGSHLHHHLRHEHADLVVEAVVVTAISVRKVVVLLILVGGEQLELV